MNRRFLSALVLFVAGCSTASTPDATTASSAASAPATKESTASAPSGPLEAGATEAPAGQQYAYFAGGCFWGVEHYLEKMSGVLEVESGYMGGTKDNPTYEDVLTHTTGHLEAVRVRFNPGEVTYREVAKRFFEIHDPTQKNGQGPDIGNQYLSAVFFASPEQKQSTEELIGLLEKKGLDVATTVRPATTFWKAEGYHQDYYARNGKKPYCHTRVRRFD